jgi:hypothetical protein
MVHNTSPDRDFFSNAEHDERRSKAARALLDSIKPTPRNRQYSQDRRT